MYHINDDRLAIGYIKETLHSFNLPKCRAVYKDDDLLYPNKLYIYQNKLYSYVGKQVVKLKDIKNNNNLFKFLYPYYYNEMIPNITKNYIIKDNIYDIYTHNYLGDFLRFHRDYSGVDLMPLYNCFAGEMPLHLDISYKMTSDTTFVMTESSEKYNVYMVKIRPDIDYTIALDSNTQVDLIVGLYSNIQLKPNEETKQEFDLLYRNTHRKITGISYNNPYLFRINSSDLSTNILLKESLLTLFIRVAKPFNSSISILEGNYLKYTDLYLNNNGEKQLGEQKIINTANPNIISKLSLLNLNTVVSVPFADRLIEYMLGNVITPNDQIKYNIELVVNFFKKLNMWDNLDISLDDNVNRNVNLELNNKIKLLIQQFIYKNNLNSKYQDLLGYYDKDIERFNR